MDRRFLDTSVFDKAVERVATVFDHFEDVSVSVSGGKDSTVLFWLAVWEAQRRGRTVRVFFLDQEVEYLATIDLMDAMMRIPNVVPAWYQVPLQLTNATSYETPLFRAWGEGETWIREKHPLAVHAAEGHPERFYAFFKWMERSRPGAAFLVGLRSEESLNRWKAVTLNPGWNGVRWSTRAAGRGSFRFYPLYDWGMPDVWKCISDNGLPYNAIYDKMYRANKGFHRTMRVSNLVHEKSFRCLKDLQAYEPETFDRVVARMSGVHVASLYAGEKTVFDVSVLPDRFCSWLEYRDYLLATTPLTDRDRFVHRFSVQPQDEAMFRRQVRQILLNDYENNLGVKASKPDRRKSLLEKWWDVL